MNFLQEPTASEPDIMDAGLKRQLHKLMAIRARGPRNMAAGALTVPGNTWMDWLTENKWGLLICVAIVTFFYYRWRYCQPAAPSNTRSERAGAYTNDRADNSGNHRDTGGNSHA